MATWLGKTAALAATAGLTGLAAPVWADTLPAFNLYGLPGLIDMPTAEPAPDGTLALTYGYVGGANRGSLSFQLAPRLSGPSATPGFRISTIRPRWTGSITTAASTSASRSSPKPTGGLRS
jgi:hypothetical protein